MTTRVDRPAGLQAIAERGGAISKPPARTRPAGRSDWCLSPEAPPRSRYAATMPTPASGPSDARPRGGLTRRRILQCVAIALVLGVEYLIASVSIIDGHAFNDGAVEMERTRTWRYGYLWQYHGAVLVKTRLVTGAPPIRPIRANDDIAPIMARELYLLPRKAAFEVGFYGSLWALWSGGLSPLRRRFSGTGSTPRRRSVAVGLSIGIMVTAFFAPLLIAGYGEPLFSKWHGPGALSYTTSDPGSTDPAWGYSFTYGAAVQALMMWPLLTLGWALALLEPIGDLPAFLLLRSRPMRLGARCGNGSTNRTRGVGHPHLMTVTHKPVRRAHLSQAFPVAHCERRAYCSGDGVAESLLNTPSMYGSPRSWPAPSTTCSSVLPTRDANRSARTGSQPLSSAPVCISRWRGAGN